MKPKLSGAEVKARRAERLRAVRVQMSIYRWLDSQSIETPADIGTALGLPAADAIALLQRKNLRPGDTEQLEELAARLQIVIPPQPKF